MGPLDERSRFGMPESRPRSRRQISATAISFDNRLCGGLSTYTKSLVAERPTLTLAEFASSLVRTRLIPPLPATQLDSKAIIFRHSEEVYGIIPTVPAGEIRRASTLQSGRWRNLGSFMIDDTCRGTRCVSSLCVSIRVHS